MISKKRIKRLESKKTQLSNIIDDVIYWCSQNFGKSKYHRDIPEFYISFEEEEDAVAEYDFEDNEITLHILNIKTMKELCTNVIHEYIHYLQPKSWYKRYTNIIVKNSNNNKVSYTDYFSNPYEFEAKYLSELEVDYCMFDLKTKSGKI